MITELKVGDYIEKSELDTEQRYNDVVEVFRDCGFWCKDSFALRERLIKRGGIALCGDLEIYAPLPHQKLRLEKRKLTYNDIMSLKKVDVDNCNIDKAVSGNESTDNTPKIHPSLLDGSDLNVGNRSNGGPVNSGPFAEPETTEKINIKEMIKSAKAVLAMESLGHEWDEEKGQWFRKEYF